MRLKYTGTPTIDLSSLGLGLVATNGIFDINPLKLTSLADISPLSNFTDVDSPVPGFIPTSFSTAQLNSGTLANRPTAGVSGRLYFATDANTSGGLYYDNGSSWSQVSPGATGGVTNAMLEVPTDNALNAARMGKWTYNFSVLGGAVGTIALTGASLPVNTIIVAGFMEVTTALTTGTTSTAAVTVQGANDVVSATTVAGAPWSTTGRKAIVPVWSDMTKAIKVASTAKTPSIVVGSADLTDGVFNLFLVTFQSDS